MCGYSFDQIDGMTMGQFNELAEYWRIHTPVHILVAGFVGYKPRPLATQDAAQSLFSLLGADPDQGGVMRLH